MSQLKISLSGIRGIIGKSLTPELVLDFALAFGSYTQPNSNIAVGMDTRSSNEMLKNIIISGLTATGHPVLDLGIVPTPTVLSAVRKKKWGGGIIITASHNSKEWNGLKFVSSEGIFVTSEEWNDIYKIYINKQYYYKPFNHLGKTILYHKEAQEEHILSVLKLADLEKIRSRKFKVSFDPVNGAGCEITKSLLERLGCDIYSIHDDPTKEFSRSPEPLPDNIKDLEKLVLENSCDIGFAQDPDADRLAIVSEKGVAIGEEYTLAFAVDQYLKTVKTDVVVNISTSRMIDDLASKYDVRVIKTAVGEVNVVKAILDNQCKIGGEGNGGVIIPDINCGRDSLVGIVTVLNALAENYSTVTQLTERIPKYYFVKDKVEIGNLKPELIYERMIKDSKQENSDKPPVVSRLDGVKVDYPDYWIQVRESNTEPIIRIFVEAKSEQLAREKAFEFKKLCQSIK